MTKPKYHLAKLRCRSRYLNIPFDLAVEDIVQFRKATHCEYCGIKFGDSNTNTKLTLDRVIAEKGYIKANIAVICHLCNNLKGSLSLSEYLQLLDKARITGKFSFT